MRLLRSSVCLLLVLFAVRSGLFAAPVPHGHGMQPYVLQAGDPPERPHNIILFISDGMGPAAVTMARNYVTDVLGRSGLTLDQIEVGSIRTRSSDSRVTDSAAGATAYSAGVHTYNGAISVDTRKRPVGTVLEAAEARGMATGLAVLSRITHATPAAFVAHVPDRDMEAEIAAQLTEQGADVLFGGGARYFLSDGGSRKDGRDLIQEMKDKGYQVVLNKDAFMGSLRTPVLGLFASDAMAFDIDRDTLVEPSLAQMTAKAIDLLDDDPDGFFLMVEASHIDHGGHANDPAAELGDVVAYDKAVAVAVAYARRTGNTLIVGTSDHETGGLSLGRDGIYQWNPAVLSRVKASADRIVETMQEEGITPVEAMRRYTGISDLKPQERSELDVAGTDAGALSAAIKDIVSRRADVGWTTHGHTAVDVKLYAFGPGSEVFVGNHENVFVGQEIAKLLGLDLQAETEKLRQTASTH